MLLTILCFRILIAVYSPHTQRVTEPLTRLNTQSLLSIRLSIRKTQMSLLLLRNWKLWDKKNSFLLFKFYFLQKNGEKKPSKICPHIGKKIIKSDRSEFCNLETTQQKKSGQELQGYGRLHDQHEGSEIPASQGPEKKRRAVRSTARQKSFF